MSWIVIRYVFDDEHKVWKPSGHTVFKTDKELLNFLRSQSKVAYKYRYEITTTTGD